jgi:hypothetical protein
MINITHLGIKPLTFAVTYRYPCSSRYPNGHLCLVSVGELPLHATVMNFKPFHFRNGYVTAVFIFFNRALVSEAKPPSGPRSGLLKIPVGTSIEL